MGRSIPVEEDDQPSTQQQTPALIVKWGAVTPVPVQLQGTVTLSFQKLINHYWLNATITPQEFDTNLSC